MIVTSQIKNTLFGITVALNCHKAGARALGDQTSTPRFANILLKSKNW